MRQYDILKVRAFFGGKEVLLVHSAGAPLITGSITDEAFDAIPVIEWNELTDSEKRKFDNMLTDPATGIVRVPDQRE